ncbi:MAG: imidazoleglycerol-phosphate dehydratase HisB [Elusimicrobiota bacterium]
MRIAEINRDTNETKIRVKINLDGSGESKITTPNGFFNHMLELLSKHSGVDMDIDVKGDTEVDLHHTVEDTGIVLGEALLQALGDKKGIERYASVMMVMDEVRCDVALDLGGRPNLVYLVSVFGQISADKKSGFDYSLIKEFMKAVSDNLKATIHIHHVTADILDILGADSTNYNFNYHHVAEAIFKGLARTLKQAVKITGQDIPSTKGMI